MKLLIALQYYPADSDRAMRLGRMIADIEPAPRSDVEFMFVRRWDTGPLFADVMVHMSNKFKVHVMRTTTKWDGWPAGPNAMAMDLLRELQLWDGVDGVLMIEPDCVPTSRYWLDVLIDAWENARQRGKWIMGAWRPSGGQYGHINGNCIIRPDIGRLVDLNTVGEDLAWDCALAPYLKDRWDRTGAIKNCFESRNATRASLIEGEGVDAPVLVHGFKDDSAYNLMAHLTQPPEEATGFL